MVHLIALRGVRQLNSASLRTYCSIPYTGHILLWIFEKLSPIADSRPQCLISSFSYSIQKFSHSFLPKCILRATVGVLCDCKLVPEGARQLFCGLELSIQPGCLWHFDSWAVSHDYGHDWVDVVGNQLLDGSSSNVNKSQCSQLAGQSSKLL